MVAGRGGGRGGGGGIKKREVLPSSRGGVECP